MPIHATLDELAAAARAYSAPDKISRIVFQVPAHDGAFAGAAMKLSYPGAEYTELDYRNYKLDPASFAGQHVLFAAVAPKPEDFAAIANVAASVTIIDHSESSAKNYAGYPGFFTMPLVNNRPQHTGADMLWAYAQPGKACPMVARCVADNTSFNKVLPDTELLIDGLSKLHNPQLKLDEAVEYLKADQQEAKFATARAVGHGVREAKAKKVAELAASAELGVFTPPNSSGYSAMFLGLRDYDPTMNDVAKKLYTDFPVDMVVIWHPLFEKGNPVLVEGTQAKKLAFRVREDSPIDVRKIAALYVWNGQPGGGAAPQAAGATCLADPRSFFVKAVIAGPDAKPVPMEVDSTVPEAGFAKPSIS